MAPIIYVLTALASFLASGWILAIIGIRNGYGCFTNLIETLKLGGFLFLCISPVLLISLLRWRSGKLNTNAFKIAMVTSMLIFTIAFVIIELVKAFLGILMA